MKICLSNLEIKGTCSKRAIPTWCPLKASHSRYCLMWCPQTGSGILMAPMGAAQTRRRLTMPIISLNNVIVYVFSIHTQHIVCRCSRDKHLKDAILVPFTRWYSTTLILSVSSLRARSHMQIVASQSSKKQHTVVSI